MLKRSAILATAAAACLLAACFGNPNRLLRDPQADAAARSIFDMVRHQQTAELAARMQPEARTPATLASVGELARSLPQGQPRARTPVNTVAVKTPGQGTLVRITDEYDFGDRKALVYTEVHTAEGRPDWKLIAFKFQVATAQELAANRLTLLGKPPIQLLFLAYVIACAVLMAAALVKVIRTRGLRRKWLWGVLAFLGLFAINMNWTTGHVDARLLSVQLIGLGVVRALTSFSPWTVMATVPVGALLILTGIWANPARAQPVRNKRPAAAGRQTSVS